MLVSTTVVSTRNFRPWTTPCSRASATNLSCKSRITSGPITCDVLHQSLVPQSRLLVPQLDHVASLEKFNSRDLAAPSNTNTNVKLEKSQPNSALSLIFLRWKELS